MPSDSDLLNSMGFLTGRTHALIKKRIQRYLDQEGIPLKMENFPAMNLLLKEKDVSQQDIANRIGFDRHRTSRMLDELEQAGLICRMNHPDNRREKRIVLTELGCQSLETIQQAVTKATNDATNGLPVGQSLVVVGALQRMINNLK